MKTFLLLLLLNGTLFPLLHAENNLLQTMSNMMTQQKIDAFKAHTLQFQASIRRRLAHDQWGIEYFLNEAKELYGVFNRLLHIAEE
jgi:hypothetical protein